MRTTNLADHYDAKYAAEAAGSARVAPLVKVPRDRYEAAVAIIRANFKGGAILEIGGGDGTVARSILAAGVPFERYTLTDLSATRAKGAAKSLSDPRFEGRVLDVERSIGDLKGRLYDAIIMTSLIEHLVDPIGAMKNLLAVLRAGGFAYIETPNIAKYSRRIKLLMGRFPSTGTINEGLSTMNGEPVTLHEEGHFHYWTFRSMSLMLTQFCGFTRIQKAPYWPARDRIPDPIASGLSKLWPEMFCDVSVLAWK